MRSRAMLAGLVVAAIAAAAILLSWPRSTSHERSEQAADGAAARSGTGGGQGSIAPDRDTPAAGAGGVGSDEADQDRVGRVRDHRGETPSHPRTRSQPGARPRHVVDRMVIADLRRSLRPEIKRCSDEHGEGLAADAVIQGSLQVTVRSGVLSVVEAKVEHRGIPETSGLIECARKAFAAAEVKAEGHDDVDKHVLRLPFKVPVK